jgi:hypothetical protein
MKTQSVKQKAISRIMTGQNRSPFHYQEVEVIDEDGLEIVWIPLKGHRKGKSL